MTTPRERLIRLRKELGGISQAKFAQAVSLPPYTINSIEGGKQKDILGYMARAISQKIVSDSKGNMRILSEQEPKKEDEENLGLNWLQFGEGEPFSIFKPSFIKIHVDEETYTLPYSKNILFYKIKDNIMSPDFSNKDIVAINSSKKEIENGKCYLLKYDDQICFRKLYKTYKNKYKILCTNELFGSYDVNSDEIEVLGEFEYMIRINL